MQRVAGIEFCYQPPPRHVVPYAAALKNHGSSPSRCVTHRPLADFVSCVNASIDLHALSFFFPLHMKDSDCTNNLCADSGRAAGRRRWTTLLQP